MAADIFDKRTRFFPVQNVDTEEAPPYALLFCDADAQSWPSDGNRIFLPVRRTTATGAGSSWCPGMHIWLANSPIAIAPGGFGVGTVDWPYKILLDPSTTQGAILASAITDGDPVLGPKQDSWGVIGNPSIRLFNMVSADPVDPALVWIVEYRDIKPPSVFYANLSGALAGSSGTVNEVTVPQDGMYQIFVSCSIQISTPGAAVTLTVSSDDTKFPDLPLGFASFSGTVGQDKWALSQDTYNDDTIQLTTPAVLNLSFSGILNLAMGDTVTVSFSTSNASAQAYIASGMMYGVLIGAPFFSVVGQGS